MAFEMIQLSPVGGEVCEAGGFGANIFPLKTSASPMIAESRRLFPDPVFPWITLPLH